ncbi:MAG: hypothetical protein KF835_16190 [Xanthobacteraceae bacterium]|nr:hypothetical protein [Xanthobacteraceae bacterium]
MHTPHEHAHHSAHTPRVRTGVSLLRLSATARLGIASILAGLIWLIVYLVLR